ncbi:ABC transporter substrate-binding protein [Robbsia sp. Bb-Pol-6]|uniref:ABC transporter substrate-binding protein n=1 Tax=Robbsia betulipollinis TaxID=2981849 RepID=A0ABT3ZS13_9BURK|nr:ABC transporter substrate-binding protein [Robbsia betulipollinis]MCY0389353.1 ABC transporter substrate-binding protein [Robbsia betulipollinis]
MYKKMMRSTPVDAGRRASGKLVLAISLALTTLSVQHMALAADRIQVGTTPSSPPSAFLDVQTKTMQGVMPDVMNEIAKREGLDITFDTMPFSALVQSVVSGKIDVIVAGMKPTPRREEVVDFAAPVFSFGETVVLPDGDRTKYRHAADMKGKVLGLPAGTTYAEAIAKLSGFKEIKYYESSGDGVMDLSHGRIDAFFGDAPIMNWMAQHGQLRGMHVDVDYVPIQVGGVAIAVKKGNKPLLDKINAGIAAMKADGTLRKILQKWHLQ